MRVLSLILLMLLILLQYQLWFAKDGGILKTLHLHQIIAEQDAVNNNLDAQNRALIANVEALRNGGAAVEDAARQNLGMVKRGEVFYRVVP